MKKLILLLLCVCLLVGTTQARTSADLRKELDALKAQAEELRTQGDALEQQIAANKTDTQSVIDRKFDIDRQISQTEQEIQNANDQIQSYSLLIAQKQSDLEAAEAACDAMNETYKERLRAMEEHGSVSYWSILFKSSSFADLLDRVNMIREIAEADNRMLEELQAAADRVELERELLQNDLEAQELTKAHLSALEGELETQRAEADVCLRELQAVLDGLSEEYAELSVREAAVQKEVMDAQAAYDKALSAEEAQRLAELNRNNAAGSATPPATPGASGFQHPVGSAPITDAYGWRTHPVTGKKNSFHTGVDFAVGMNTPIHAMASGTVSARGSTGAYGNSVTLSHGGGYGSFYAHMNSVAVSVGDTVSQGDIIGYAGSTGVSTGPHLHFEIYVNGGTVNPMEYVG